VFQVSDGAGGMGPFPHSTHGGFHVSSSGIAARTNPERTNRWLLIGAVALAVLAGILVFAALANVGSDDGTPAAVAGEGTIQVIVATDTIRPGTVVTEDMVQVRTVGSTDSLVPGAIADESIVVGQVARTEILANQQISSRHFSVGTGGALPFSYTVPDGMRALSVGVNEVSAVAGLVFPGDRVDLIITLTQVGTGDTEVIRVETLLEDVELLAFAQTALEAAPPATDDAAGDTPGSSAGDRGLPPDTFDPNPRAGTATLALTPQQVHTVVAAQRMGSITLALRHPGDREQGAQAAPVFFNQAGFVPPPPPGE
jgi:pilus assembly protein CpaB